MVNFYTVYDLRRLRSDQTHLYLLCYAWLRYRQLTHNLVDALAFHMNKMEADSSADAKKAFDAEKLHRQQEAPRVGRLLSLYVDDRVAATTPFGQVRERAYKIMPRDALQSTAQRLSVKPSSRLARHMTAVDGLADLMRRGLRPLFGALDFASTRPDNPWLTALAWAKGVFAKQQSLSQRPLTECLTATLPKRLQPYLLVFDDDGNPTGLNAGRYEFWLYRQIRKGLKSGELFVDDSLQHRHLLDELVSVDEKASILKQMDIPFLRQPIDAQLDALKAELHSQWIAFNRELKQGKLTHLDYDKETQTLTWRKPKLDKQPARERAIYEQLSLCDAAVDGQKFGVERPTVKARYSRKYLGRGRGVAAYTLLCNHIPLNGYLIGAHEYEGHYVFDIWFRNTTDIVPTVITGDMHTASTKPILPFCIGSACVSGHVTPT